MAKSCRVCGKSKPQAQFQSFTQRGKRFERLECTKCYNQKVIKKRRDTAKAINNAILIIPDMHAPYHHRDTIAFLSLVADIYKPVRVVCLGDEVDNHALSFHESDPDLLSAGAELAGAKSFMRELAALFPKMDLLDSNHGSLAYRRGKHHGIPRAMIRDYNEILEAPPGWKWHQHLVIDGILFHHGDGKRADAVMTARYEFMSVVMGHHHSEFGIRWQQSLNGAIFGMNCGCLIDDESLAFAYNKKTSKRPILGCGLIVNGQPILIKMRLDAKGRWVGSL